MDNITKNKQNEEMNRLTHLMSQTVVGKKKENFEKILVAEQDKTDLPTIDELELMREVHKTLVTVNPQFISSYLNMISVERLCNNIKEAKKVAEDMVVKYASFYEQAIGFYKAGIKPKVDVTIAEVNLSNAKLNLIQAKFNSFC